MIKSFKRKIPFVHNRTQMEIKRKKKRKKEKKEKKRKKGRKKRKKGRKKRKKERKKETRTTNVVRNAGCARSRYSEIFF